MNKYITKLLVAQLGIVTILLFEFTFHDLKNVSKINNFETSITLPEVYFTITEVQRLNLNFLRNEQDAGLFSSFNIKVFNSLMLTANSTVIIFLIVRALFSEIKYNLFSPLFIFNRVLLI